MNTLQALLVEVARRLVAGEAVTPSPLAIEDGIGWTAREWVRIRTVVGKWTPEVTEIEEVRDAFLVRAEYGARRFESVVTVAFVQDQAEHVARILIALAKESLGLLPAVES